MNKTNHFASLLVCAICSMICFSGYAQNVGIGTNTPVRLLHLNGTGTYNAIKITNTPSGTTSGDGMDIGLQFQADNVGNRYGTILLYENVPLKFGTNGFSHMELSESGNLGIGVADAALRLEINGSMRMRGFGRRLLFRNNDSDGDAASIGLLNDSVVSIADHNPGAQFSRFYFQVKTQQFSIGGLPNLEDGRLLVVHNSSTSTPHVTLRENTANDFARLEFANTGTERFWHLAGQIAAGAGATNRENDLFNIWNSSRGDIFSIRGDGRVGILTTTPATGYALSVNGKIICNELRVQLTNAWPDYVFADDYSLPSLQEVESFIKTNRHLPGIPKAAEVEANGQDVGDIQKKMMEKIEELTLYVIQQQKQLSKQQQEIDALKKQPNSQNVQPSISFTHQ